jgi:hypothetical protein
LRTHAAGAVSRRLLPPGAPGAFELEARAPCWHCGRSTSRVTLRTAMLDHTGRLDGGPCSESGRFRGVEAAERGESNCN